LYRMVRCLRPPALAPQLKRDPLGGVLVTLGTNACVQLFR
jgi:hypothetical protein